MIKKSPLLLCFMILGGLAGPARADPVLTETQLLSFGEIAVATNAVESITVNPDGTNLHDPGIQLLLPGRNGVYLFSSFGANIPVAVSVADAELTGPNNAKFDMHDFTFDPVDISQITDGSGEMTLKIGATMSTRAGVTYEDGPYRGTYTLMVNY